PIARTTASATRIQLTLCMKSIAILPDVRAEIIARSAFASPRDPLLAASQRSLRPDALFGFLVAEDDDRRRLRARRRQLTITRPLASQPNGGHVRAGSGPAVLCITSQTTPRAFRRRFRLERTSSRGSRIRAPATSTAATAALRAHRV